MSTHDEDGNIKFGSPIPQFAVTTEQREWVDLAAGVDSKGIAALFREMIDAEIVIAKEQGLM